MSLADGTAWENEFGTGEISKEKTMNKFKNTYISTAHLSPEELAELAKKYSKASGYPIEEDFLDSIQTHSNYNWNYLASVLSEADKSSQPCDSISCDDDLCGFVSENLTEITEQDLDNHLAGLQPVKDMTPCEKLGYKVGDKFEVVESEDYDSVFLNGSIIELYNDDKSDRPLFKLVKGDCCYQHCDGEDGGYFSLSCIKPFKETNTYPTEDFKISLEGMSDVEKELAKEWLKEVAKDNSWDYHYLEDSNYEVNYVWTEDLLCTGNKGYNVATLDGSFTHVDLPQLTLTFSAPTITGFNLPDKKSKEVLQMEELVGRLTTQLEEANKALEELKQK